MATASPCAQAARRIAGTGTGAPRCCSASMRASSRTRNGLLPPFLSAPHRPGPPSQRVAGGEQHIPDRAARQATKVHPFGVCIRRQTRQRSGRSCRRRPPTPSPSPTPRSSVPRSWRTTSAARQQTLVRPLQIVEHQVGTRSASPACASRLRTSANMANRWALPESAPSVSPRHSSSPKTRDHRPRPDESSSVARTAGSSSTSCHRPYGGKLSRSAALDHATGTPLAGGRRGGLLRPTGSSRSPPRPCTAPGGRHQPGHHRAAA